MGQNALDSAVVQVPGGLLQLRAVLLRRAGAEHHPEDVSAHVDGAGGLDLGGDVDAPVGDQGGGELRLEPGAGAVDVQQGDDDGVPVREPLQGGEGPLQGVALHAHKDHVRLVGDLLLLTGPHRDGEGAVAGLQHQAVFLNGLQVGAPGDEGHVLSPLGQEGGQAAPDAPGPIDQILHGYALLANVSFCLSV